jgi:hypothetical protein
MTNYQVFSNKINSSKTKDALKRNEVSLRRLFDAGIFTENQLIKLDYKIIQRYIEIEVY